jgi:hypothetical protein
MAKTKPTPAPVDKPVIKLLDVVGVAKRVVAAYHEWGAQDGPNVPWRGATVKALSQKLHMTIAEACDSVADFGKEVEPAARKLILAFDELAESFTDWLQAASMNLDTAPPRGSVSLHNALQRLEIAIQPSKYQKPDPIKQLLDVQRVSPHQIAKIYGWKLEDGSGDVAKVFEEYATPGTHYNAETWVHPADVAVQAEVEERWVGREPRVVRFRAVETEASESQQQEFNPATLDEYLANGATIKQMVSFLKIEESFLEMYAEEKGYQLVGDKYVSKEQLEKDAAAKRFQEAAS